jgi:hypothetical protein
VVVRGEDSVRGAVLVVVVVVVVVVVIKRSKQPTQARTHAPAAVVTVK